MLCTTIQIEDVSLNGERTTLCMTRAGMSVRVVNSQRVGMS